MVVCTPYMDEAERCHRVGMMHHGRFLVVDEPQGIIDKHTEKVYEMTGAPQDRARRILSESSELLDVYPFGDALHIAASERDDVKMIVRRAFEKCGEKPGDIAVIRPTFEDVFMSKVRKEE